MTAPDGDPAVWAVGLMTGTVLDGNIDVALLRTDGERVLAAGPHALLPAPPELRPLLVETLAAAGTWNFVGPEPAIFAVAEEALTRAQSAAVLSLLADAGLTPGAVAVIGFHGQTVLHRAPAAGRKGATRQLGDGVLMQALTGIPVAYDFHSADVAAGGNGAPLAPVYHRALLASLADPGDYAFVNLGGVGNLTWWDGGETLVAFDTGPANAPINDFMAVRGLCDMDRDGALAATGTVDEARLRRLLAHPYLAAPAPKSLDRNGFTSAMADGLADADGAALLTAFSAACVAAGLSLLPRRPSHLVVSGGGRRNPTLMRMLAERSGCTVLASDTFGWDGDAVEAQLFALLAVRVLRGLPISFPGTTGVPQPMTGGRLARGPASSA